MTLPSFIKQTLAETGATAQQTVRAFNAQASNLADIFTALLKRVQLDSILLQSVSLVAGSNQVPHTLGRTLTGWKLTRLRANVAVWDVQAQPLPSTYLTLVASAPVVVDLEVF